MTRVEDTAALHQKQNFIGGAVGRKNAFVLEGDSRSGYQVANRRRDYNLANGGVLFDFACRFHCVGAFAGVEASGVLDTESCRIKCNGGSALDSALRPGKRCLSANKKAMTLSLG